jgi:hypothetical protein
MVLGMLFFVFGGFFEDFGDVVIALLPGDFGKKRVLVTRLLRACDSPANAALRLSVVLLILFSFHLFDVQNILYVRSLFATCVANALENHAFAGHFEMGWNFIGNLQVIVGGAVKIEDFAAFGAM